MTSHKQWFQLGTRLRFASLVATASALLSCSEDSIHEGSREESAGRDSTGADSQHRLRLFIGTAAGTRELRVRPAKALWGFPLRDTGSKELRAGLVPNAKITYPDGTEVEESEDLDSPDAWLLVRAAMLSCGSGPLADKPFPKEKPTTFYFMPGLVGRDVRRSCDKLLRAQQVLLCAGDKLAQVSESRGATVWNVPDTSDASMPAGSYAIAPVTERDAFIARDLAIHTLAHVAWLDLIPVDSRSRETCTDVYGAGAQNGTDALGMRELLFELDASNRLVFDDLPQPRELVNGKSNAQSVAVGRLAFKSHVLRATSRLLPDLISKGVYADLAGAARRRSRQGDTGRGQAVVWGTRDPEGGYNSLAHAARVVGQRWQAGRLTLTPWQDALLDQGCSSVSPGDALHEAYGDDMEARSGNLPIITKGQRDAIARLESTGIVFGSWFDDQDPEQRKATITNQLLFQAAVEKGMPSTTASAETFRQTPAGRNIEATFDGVSDEDFRFAVVTLRDRYRVLTQSQGVDIPVELTATVNMPASKVHPSYGSFFGSKAAVFDGPMPKTDLDTDIFARVGGLQNVSQCTESGAADFTYGTDDAWDFAMQDGFALGQALYSRLVAVRETGAKEAAAVAEAAAAETRAWSGEGRIFVRGLVDDIADPTANDIELITLGFEPEDVGVETPAQMESQLALVWGRPLHAQCAAGLSRACPADLSKRMASLAFADVRSLMEPVCRTFPKHLGEHQNVFKA